MAEHPSKPEISASKEGKIMARRLLLAICSGSVPGWRAGEVVLLLDWPAPKAHVQGEERSTEGF